MAVDTWADGRKKRLKHQFIEHTDIQEKWYQEDEKGAVALPKKFISTNPGSRALSKAATAAMALTELCCTKGIGKVYVLVPNALDLKSDLTLPEIVAVASVPEVFYIPEPWTCQQQADWAAMPAEDRYERLLSRRGWLSPATPVLPFVLGYVTEKEELKRARLEGLTAASIYVCLSPGPYVGVTAEMRAVCGPRQWKYSGSKVKDPMVTGSFFRGKKSGWAVFERWKVAGGGGVLARLEEIYRASSVGPNVHTVFLQELVDELTAAHKTVEDLRAAETEEEDE